MANLLRDLRYACRLLVSRPGFTLATVLSLALGIGANVTIFSFINEVFLRPLPITAPDRVMAIHTSDKKIGDTQALSHLNWKDLREANETFVGIAGYDWTPMSVSTAGEPIHVVGQLVSGNYFDVLGVRAALGRTFLAEEDATLNTHPVAVLSHYFWSRRLGADPDIVGQTLEINAYPFTVIGVAPPEFKGLELGVQPELWVPMMMNPVIQPATVGLWYETRRGLFVYSFGRLEPGVTQGNAAADLKTIAARLEREYPDVNKNRSVRIEPVVRAAIAPWARDGVTRGSALMMAAAVLVLLIVCANVANLLLARASERRKEIALRLALGIRRRRLIRQLLTESAVLALLAGVVGLFVARWMRDALLTLLGAIPMPYQATFGLELQLDPVVLAFLLLLALGCALVFGLVPALRSSRLDLVAALKQGEATRQGRRRKLDARNALVVAQVALSLVALVGAGLFLRSHTEARQIDPGFDTEKTLMVSFDLGLQGYTPTRGVQLYRSLVERVEALPGAVSAVMAQSAPLQWTMSRSVLIEQGESNDYDRSFVETNLVGPGYFETLGIVLEEGRGIRASDREGSQRVVVVNRTMADRFWPGRSALGQRFSFFGHPPVEVVGIARDAKYSHVGEAPMPFAYLALEQEYSSLLTLLVQSSGPAEALLPLVLRELRALAPDLSLTQASTIEQVFSSTLWPSRIAAVFLVLFGVLALVLAAIGIYGVMSYAVYRRRRELGIRAALGAARSRILTMVLGESLQMVAVGLACGLLVAFWASRLVAAMLFVEATDPWAFIGALGVLVACALIATLVPALRALGAEPLSVLRHE